MAISDYNTDPDLNTSINGINIAEGCNPAGLNNSDRQIMADLAVFYDQYGVDIGRTLTVPIGEVGSSTPNVAGRANKVLLFDNLGNAGASGFSTIYAGTQAVNADSRTILANMTGMTDGQAVVLTEPGREGIFVFHAANVSTLVTGDPRQGVYVAPSATPSGASGAWVRKFSGRLNVRWFGVVADGVTDDSPAFTAAIATSKVLAGNLTGTYYIGGPGLFIPAGKYYLATTTLDITHTLVIEGEGNGQNGGVPTWLKWAANTTGIRPQRYNTSGDRIIGTTHNGADGTIIRGLFLQGAYTATDGLYHGIDANCRVTIQDVTSRDWQGNGINILANSGGANGAQGNANGFAVERCMLYTNKNGILISGSDANAGYTLGLDLGFNRECGILDQSFLGNTHIAPQAAGQGDAPYKSTDANARIVFSNAYAEAGQPACVFANGTIAIGGLLSEVGVTGGTWIRSAVARLRVEDTTIDDVQAETIHVSENINVNSNGYIAINSGSNGGNQLLSGTNLNFVEALGVGVKALNTAGGELPLRLGGDEIVCYTAGTRIITVTDAGIGLAANKTLNFAAIQNAVDDAAAAAVSVPVGSVYRNGSVLMVRVT